MNLVRLRKISILVGWLLTCECECVCVCVCVCVRKFDCAYQGDLRFPCAYGAACPPARTHARTLACTCTHAHAHTHAHACTHTHTHSLCLLLGNYKLLSYSEHQQQCDLISKKYCVLICVPR